MTVLTPAYGRKYATSKAVISDYTNGKDFILNDVSSRWDGKYCSCRDFVGVNVELRYGKHNEYLVMITNYEC